MKHQVTIVAAVCSIVWGRAFADQTSLAAMQSFQELCLRGSLSMDALANVARDRHYMLVVDRRLPGPGGSTIVNKTWQVADVTGDFALTATESENNLSARTFQCGVTLPSGTEKGVELALEDSTHFGAPDQIKTNVDGSRLVRWVRHFDWGTATISLASQQTQLQGGSMINVVYQTGQ
ncbi:MAG: hypothetical protein JSR66_30090 [Proteobacteria bacterium]|nr:hypothetical protein [Pseudomonadota bacterium]